MLLAGFVLITDNQVHWGNLALAEVFALLLGIWLGVLGLDLWRGNRPAKRVGGALLLLLASGYWLTWLGLNYWLISALLAEG